MESALQQILHLLEKVAAQATGIVLQEETAVGLDADHTGQKGA